MTKSAPIFLTEIEAADLLNVARKTLSQWRWRGLPPRYRKFNGAVRYELGDLLAFARGDKPQVAQGSDDT